MLSFKQFLLEFDLLIENRIDFLKTQFKDKLSTDHDPYGEHKHADSIVDHFSTHADPTPNKQYSGWILKQYQNGKIRQEDHPAIKSSLELFHKVKSKLPEKDIGRYKSLGDVRKAIEPFENKPSTKKEISEAGRELVHDKNDLKVYRLHTKEASIGHYGGNKTKWCTALGGAPNKFDDYNKDGPLHVIHFKDRHDNEQVHQLHFGKSLYGSDAQFMDKYDDPVDLDDFVGTHPEMRHVEAFKGLHPAFPMNDDDKKKFKSKFETDVKENKEISSHDVRRAIVGKYLTPKQVDDIIDNPNNTSSHGDLVKGHNDGHLTLSPKHLNILVNNKDSHNAHEHLIWGYRRGVLNLSPRHIDTIVKNLASTDAHTVLVQGDKSSLSPHHIDTIVNNPNDNIAHWELMDSHQDRSLQLTPKQIDTIVNNPNSNAAHWVVVNSFRDRSLKLTPQHIDTIVNNPNDNWAHGSLVDGHKQLRLLLSPNHIDAIAKTPNSTNAHQSLVHGHLNGTLKLTSDHIDTILKHPDSKGAHKLLLKAHNDGKLKLTPEQLQKLGQK